MTQEFNSNEIQWWAYCFYPASAKLFTPYENETGLEYDSTGDGTLDLTLEGVTLDILGVPEYAYGGIHNELWDGTYAQQSGSVADMQVISGTDWDSVIKFTTWTGIWADNHEKTSACFPYVHKNPPSNNRW